MAICLFYTTGGVNMPYLWAQLSMGMPIDNSSIRLKRKRTYGMTEISYLKYLKWNEPLKIIAEWWKTDCYSIFRGKIPYLLFINLFSLYKHNLI